MFHSRLVPGQEISVQKQSQTSFFNYEMKKKTEKIIFKILVLFLDWLNRFNTHNLFYIKKY